MFRLCLKRLQFKTVHVIILVKNFKSKKGSTTIYVEPYHSWSVKWIEGGGTESETAVGVSK